MTNETCEKTKRQQPPHLWKPGQSGNPAGRPKGARSKLAESFLDGMLAAYMKGGQQAIEAVMEREPSRFLSALVAILPKQLELDADVKVSVTCAVDQLIAKLETHSTRELEYERRREVVMKTIEHEPRPSVKLLFEKLQPQELE